MLVVIKQNPGTKELDECTDRGFNEIVFNYIQYSEYEKKYQKEMKIPPFVMGIPPEFTKRFKFICF